MRLMDERSDLPPGDLRRLGRSWRRHLVSAHLSPKTIRNYLDALGQLAAYLDDAGRSTVAADVDRADVEDFVGHVLATRSASTAATRYRGLQQFFRWMVDEDEVSVSPMARTRPPRVVEQPVDVVPETTVTALLRVTEGRGRTGFADRRDAAILRVLVDTGVRLGELAALRVDDVDLDRGTLDVVGKGRRRRTVKAGPKTTNALDRYLERARPEHPHAGVDALWLAPKGALGESGVAQMLRRRCRQAEVPEVHAHQFRHLFAHLFRSSGGSDGDLQSLAGWESDQMLKRYGASLAAERARAAHGRHSPGERF